MPREPKPAPAAAPRRNQGPAGAGGEHAGEAEFGPIRWRDGALELLDQTALPGREVWLRCTAAREVAAAIRRLSVRGAPAIGVAAAFGVVVGLREGRDFDDVVRELGATRPTAVNLHWALARMRAAREAARAGSGGGDDELAERLLAFARDLLRRDVETNRRMAAHGAPLLAPGGRALTHCNTGALATAGIGTALGVIAAAHRRAPLSLVWVDETRPLLQGARLTAWELERLGIPHRLITDSSAASVLRRGWVDAVFVGADRIASNGDAANKIGTYPLAVLAARHGVPFYVVAPTSTVDLDLAHGDLIPIEERHPDEVTHLAGTLVAPAGTEALNLAFDVTPADLIAGIVTEEGIARPPFGPDLARMVEGAGRR